MRVLTQNQPSKLGSTARVCHSGMDRGTQRLADGARSDSLGASHWMSPGIGCAAWRELVEAEGLQPGVRRAGCRGEAGRTCADHDGADRMTCLSAHQPVFHVAAGILRADLFASGAPVHVLVSAAGEIALIGVLSFHVAGLGRRLERTALLRRGAR